MKIEDKLISKRFYDYNEGECFVDEYGGYYMKVRECDTRPEAPVLVSYKAVDLTNGYIIEFENAQCFRPVDAKVVIE